MATFRDIPLNKADNIFEEFIQPASGKPDPYPILISASVSEPALTRHRLPLFVPPLINHNHAWLKPSRKCDRTIIELMFKQKKM